jgi:hypothetical protein
MTKAPKNVVVLMPVAKAAATSVEYPVRWEPLGPWQHERSSKI